MKKWVLFLFFFSGCVGHLHQDPSLPAISSEYPTAEFRLKDKVYHGLGIVPVVDGSDLSALGLSVQGYYTGTVRIDSTDCGISVSQQYTNFQLIPIPLSGIAHNNCVISVVLNPSYTAQSNDPIEVFGFKGTFAIRVIRAGDSWVGSVHKVTGNFTDLLKMSVGGTGLVRAVFTGCGINYDQNVALDNQGFLTIGLDQLVAKNAKTACILDGVIISPVFQDLLVNAIVSQYDPSFSPLPIPSMTLKGSTLTISGDDAVSVVGFDVTHKVSSSASFRSFDPSISHIIRAFTVKGRSVVCRWDKGIQCLQ